MFYMIVSSSVDIDSAEAFLGFADRGRKRGLKGLDASPVGPRAGVGFFRQTVLLHFKYSGWPLLTPFYVFFDRR